MTGLQKFLLFIIIFAALYLFFEYGIDFYSDLFDINIMNAQKSSDNSRSNLLNDYSGEISLEYNYPIALGNKTRDEIYTIRKKYVSSSIFSKGRYNPSDEVFGQIVDYKPWIALSVCSANEQNQTKTDGVSEEARFINNPTILVALEYPFSTIYHSGVNPSWCSSNINNLIPDKITYDGDKKLITVYYYKFPFVNRDFDFYSFNGVNANDLDYSYAYLDLAKSTFKPKFSDQNNISNQIVQFQNYIHLGSSCGVNGGCNNGSPRQTAMEFKYSGGYYRNDGEILIKLWKNMPASPDDDPDITEKIVIRKY